MRAYGIHQSLLCKKGNAMLAPLGGARGGGGGHCCFGPNRSRCFIVEVFAQNSSVLISLQGHEEFVWDEPSVPWPRLWEVLAWRRTVLEEP